MDAEENTLKLRRRKAAVLFILGMLLLSLSLFLSFITISGRPHTITIGPRTEILEKYFFVVIPSEFYKASWVSPEVHIVLKLKTNTTLNEVTCYWVDINESRKYINKLNELVPEKEYLIINKTFSVSELKRVVGFEIINENPQLPARLQYEMHISGIVQLFPIVVNYFLLFLTIIGFILAAIGFVEFIRSHAKIKYYYG